MASKTIDGRLWNDSHEEPIKEDWEEAITIFSAMTLARAISEYEGSDFEEVLEEFFSRAGIK